MPAAGLDPDVRDFLAGRTDGHVLAPPSADAAGGEGGGWRWAPPVLPAGIPAGPWPMPPPLAPAREPPLLEPQPQPPQPE